MKKAITTLVLMLFVAVAAVAATTYSKELYEKAILGDGEAMYQLSLCYMHGKGVAVDFDRSDYWLERAAEEGQPSAVAAIRALEGKTGLKDAKRRQLAAEEKRERERLLANRGGNGNGGGNTLPSNQTFTVNGISFTMVYVEGGTFTMGATSEQGSDAADKEKPAHSVTLSSFYIGQTEVTQELWQAVMGENPSWFNGYGNYDYGSNHNWGVGWNYGTNLKRPVEYVSWYDCQEFIRKLNARTGKNFRLPTEAEWEYAARGGNKSKGYKYSGSNALSDVAWYDENSESETHSVGSKHANELGLYDMSGNVLEWCNDIYGDYSNSSQTNPQGPSSGSRCVGRGGGTDFNVGGCRVSYRIDWGVGTRTSFLGLRLAL